MPNKAENDELELAPLFNERKGTIRHHAGDLDDGEDLDAFLEYEGGHEGRSRDERCMG